MAESPLAIGEFTLLGYLLDQMVIEIMRLY